MKKIYSIIGLLAISASAWAQSSYIIKKDLTSTLTNAALSGTVETVDIATYDYNMPDDGAGADPANVGKFGMQPIPGWTACAPSNNIKVMQSANDKENVRDDQANARACGIFNFIEEGASEEVPSIGGKTLTGIPVVFVNETESHPGPALGMLGVWTATVQYTQEVTLPAGAYAISANVCNVAGTTPMVKNLLGFIAEDGTEYLSTTTAFTVDQYLWTEDVAMFILEKETKGVISIGYAGPNAGSGSAPHIFYEPIHLYEIDPAPLIQAQIDAAKEDLLKVIEEGEQVGADTKAAQDIYDSASSTLQQVLDAIESQKKLNEGAIVDLSEYFISNPHFTEDVAITMNEDGTFEGITTYARDRHNASMENHVSYYGMQPVKGWVASNPCGEFDIEKTSGDAPNDGRACGVVAIGSNTWIGGKQYTVPSVMSDGSKEGQVLGFVTCWGMTTQYTQNVTIPAGKYTLTISYYNTGGDKDVAKNLMGFIADDGTEYLSDTKNFKIGSWEKMTVMFELEEATAGHFSVGYTAAGVGSANMPHFFIDGIALNYVGDATFDPSLFALQAAVGSAKELLKENFYEDLKAEFEEKVEAGDELCKAFSSDKEANKKAMDEINAMLTDINANIKAYKDLDAFADGALQDAFKKYENKAGHDIIMDALNEINDEVPNVLSDYNWDTQKINETIASLPVIIKEKTQELYDAAKAGEYEGDPIDITPIIEGLGYTYSTSDVKNTAIPDKQWIYGDASEFKTQYATAEVWNQSPFEVYQTLSNMPAGTYTVKTKAFYRTADNTTNYDNYQADQTPKAFVMGGFSKAPIVNVAELAKESETAIDGWAAVAEGSTTYVPNNQLKASEIFNDADLTEKVQASVQTVLAAEGDIKIGVTADQIEGNSWVVWYGFELEYDPNVDKNLLAEEIEAAKAVIKEYMDPMANEDAAYITAPATTAAAAALAGDDMPTLVQTIQDLKDNVKASKDVDAAFEEIQNTAGEYLDFASAEAVAKFTEVATKYSSKADLNTEELAAFVEEIKAADKALRIPDGTGASDDNPIDFTSAITNPDFEANTPGQQATGWTLVKGEGASGNYQVQNGFEGVSMEFWSNTNGSGTKYDFYQRISGLPAGTYVLTVDAANSLNNQPVGPGEGAAYIYAAAASGETLRYGMSDPIAVQEASCNGDDKTWNKYEVVVKIAEGEDLVVGSRSVGDLAARWVMIDNFMLAYHGTESALEESGDPTAIEGVAAVSSEKATAIYTISGAKVSSLQKGINIVKMADGKVKKILVK